MRGAVVRCEEASQSGGQTLSMSRDQNEGDGPAVLFTLGIVE